MEKDSCFFKLLRLGLGTETIDNGEWIVDNDHAGSNLQMCCGKTNDLLSIIHYQLSIKQGIGAFLFDGLQKATEAGLLPPDAVSREVKMKLFSHTMQVENVHKQHETVIANLAQFYAAHDVRMLLLKGYGLSLAYPNPHHRPCGDIDIWLYGDQEKADRLLHEEKGIAIDEDHHHHTIFHVGGVMIENHYNFLNTESHISNREIEKELHELIKQENEKISVSGCDVYLPPATFNALFLLRHAGQHFAAMEIALRHVTDWAMFVKHYHKEIDWACLEQIARKQNMLRFMQCLNGICIDYLGLSEDLFPKWQRDKALEERIMNDILNPAFEDKSALGNGFLQDSFYRLKRRWGQRWKHQLVYRESPIVTFMVLLRSHFVKPKAYKTEC